MHIRGWHMMLSFRSDTIIQQAPPTPAGWLRLAHHPRPPYSVPVSWTSPPALPEVRPPVPWHAGGKEHKAEVRRPGPGPATLQLCR